MSISQACTAPAASEGTGAPASFKPKRGRPSASQVVAIDGAILAAARAMFLDIGYANTSMEAVATTVGVSKGTLYARYPGKPDLFRAIVTERISAWSIEIPPPPIDEGLTLSEELIRSGNSFLSSLLVPEVAAFDHLINSEAGRFPELSQEFYDQGYVPFINGLSQRIVIASGKQPVKDARSIAIGFISALLGWFRMERLLNEPSEARIARFVSRQVEVIVGGRAAW